MTFFERAILYLKRKKSRTVLLIIIIFVASSFVLSGLALKTAVTTETENVRKNLGSSFLLKINSGDPNNIETVTTSTYSYEAYSGEYITNDMIDDIVSIEGVTNHMISSDQMVWTDLELRPGLYADSYKDYTPANSYTSEEELEIRTHSTSILPCNSSELHGNFRTGAFSIIEGRGIQEDDLHAAVISDRLAKRNNLKIGDTINIEVKEGLFQPSDVPDKTWGEPVTLNIIGMFSVNFEQEPSLYTPESEYAENLIYTDWDTGVQINSYVRNGNVLDEYWEVTFFVDNPSNMTSIINQVKATDHFDPKYFIIELDNTTYRATEHALNQLNVLALILIAAGIIGCLAILTLTLNMWTKNRKQEIGILLSIGTGKREIIFQLILECMIVTVVALILTIVLSGKLTGALCSYAEKMTYTDNQTNEYTIETPTGSLIPTITKNSSMALHFDSTVSSGTIAIIILTTCFMSMASVTLAAVQTIKVNPKNLLQSL